jgi:hypothetical protein
VAAVGDLEAMEARPDALCRVAKAGCGHGPGRSNGRECAWPVATGQQPGPCCGAALCLLRLARDSQIDGPLRALPAEPPYTCPIRTVVWEGGSREASPYPDPTPILRDSAELRSVRGTAEVAP